MTDNDTVNALKEAVRAFCAERDWDQFHNPKDMAISIALEAAELLEVFQWSGTDTEADTDKKMEKIREELADVLIYALLMGYDLDLDISEIVNSKIEENNRKYPARKAYGKADKYTSYVDAGGKGE